MKCGTFYLNMLQAVVAQPTQQASSSESEDDSALFGVMGRNLPVGGRSVMPPPMIEIASARRPVTSPQAPATLLRSALSKQHHTALRSQPVHAKENDAGRRNWYSIAVC